MTKKSGGIDETWEQMDVDAIYAAYPRRVKPIYAKKCIRKALTRIYLARLDLDDLMSQPHADMAPEWLLERVQAYAKSPAGNKGEFTPHPASWMNAGSYDEDESEWQCDDGRTAKGGAGAKAGGNAGVRRAETRGREFTEPDVGLPSI